MLDPNAFPWLLIAGFFIGVGLMAVLLEWFGAVAPIIFGVLILLLLLLVPTKAKADEPDLLRCTVIAGAYNKNPFAVPLADLDTLRQCLSAQMAATVQQKENERTLRAIDRNFGGKLEDAE